MSTFVAGDRVILTDPDGWLQPFRKLGEQKRVATITAIYGEGDTKRHDLLFDVKRKGATPPKLLRVLARDLELEGAAR